MRVRATRKEQSSGPSEVVYSPTHLYQRLDTLVAAGALCSGHRRRPQLFIYTRARAWAQHDQSSRGRTSCGQYAVRGDDPKRWAVASAHRAGHTREYRVDIDLPQPHAGTAADAVGALVGVHGAHRGRTSCGHRARCGVSPKRWPAAYAYRTGHTTVGGATRASDMALDSYHSIVDVFAATFSGVWSVPHANLARGKIGSPREAARSSKQPSHNVLRAPRAGDGLERGLMERHLKGPCQ